jgi:hypothetical protein
MCTVKAKKASDSGDGGRIPTYSIRSSVCRRGDVGDLVCNLKFSRAPSFEFRISNNFVDTNHDAYYRQPETLTYPPYIYIAQNSYIYLK